MAKMTALKILEEAAALKQQKSKDYQGSQFEEEDYFPFGDLSYMQMVHTKYLRMRSVLNSGNPNFESLEDSLIDMINYCAMWAAYIVNKEQSDEK